MSHAKKFPSGMLKNAVFQRPARLHRARARYLNQALQLEEHRPSRIISAAILVSAGLLLGTIAWASITHVNEVAHAPGEVVPAGYIHDIQHLEGGIVSAIHVANGDHVRRNQPLVSLAPTISNSTYEQLRIRGATLALEAERLRALLNDEQPDFGELAERYPELAKQQKMMFLAQKEQLKTELAVIDARIRQRESEHQRQRNQARTIRAEVRLLREQVGIRRKLADNNVVSKTELLATQSRLAETLSERRRILDDISVAEASLAEARERRLDRLNKLRRDMQMEIGRVASKLAENRHALDEARDRVRRLEIRAPTDGIVKGLSITSINAVIKPGQVIMQIVPVASELVVEARVSPRDIGHVHVGQPAEVRLAAYDASRFGSIPGEVKRLSASTYLDARRQPYYRAEIALSADHVGTLAAGLRILPGMTATANIQTGDKTIMAYLMKPVSRGFGNAFVER